MQSQQRGTLYKQKDTHCYQCVTQTQFIVFMPLTAPLYRACCPIQCQVYLCLCLVLSSCSCHKHKLQNSDCSRIPVLAATHFLKVPLSLFCLLSFFGIEIYSPIRDRICNPMQSSPHLILLSTVGYFVIGAWVSRLVTVHPLS